MFVCEAESMKRHWKACGSGTCHIRLVILMRVDWYLPNWANHPDARQFQMRSDVPTISVHYASETSIVLFGNPFWMNLSPVKPCAVIIGIKWLKNHTSSFRNFFLCAGTHPKAPSLPFIYYYFRHHNYQGLLFL
jgi:hypothetical protein